MTDPTDAEIDTLILEHGVMGQAWPTQRQLHAFARAVLAKWGTPAPVGVEPAGYALVPVEPTPEMLSEIWVHKNGSLSEAYRAMLAAAPQPTQAQAVAGGEPVAWLSVDCIGERYLCFTRPDDDDPVRPLVFGDTAPPTHDQETPASIAVAAARKMLKEET